MPELLDRIIGDPFRHLPYPDSPVGVEGLSGGGPVTTHATRADAGRVRLEPPRVGGVPVAVRVGRKVRLQYRRNMVPCTATGVVMTGPDDGLWIEVHSVERLQRRAAVRVPLQMDVEVSLPAPFGEDPEVILAVTENLSAGGALLRTTEELERGWSLRLRFTLPGDTEEFTMRARVVHTSADERRTQRRYRAGVEFLGLEHEDREYLVRYTLGRDRELRRRAVGLDPLPHPLPPPVPETWRNPHP